MDIPILNPRHEWACPNCTLRDVTTESRPHSRMHACAGVGGLTTPMLSAADVEARRVKVVHKVREDYIGEEVGIVTDQDGRPIMATETQYEDGRTDLAVYAPVATGEGKA